MTCLTDFKEDLRTHLNLCNDVLGMVERENESLRASGSRLDLAGERKKVLAQLTESLDKIREHRLAWLELEPAVRQDHPEITELLRDNQNIIMKILVLDRENEQALLRKGMVPARHVPSANRHRPHFVANLYQRNSAI